jgi:glycosyltransferase involved in cell wall biosynthesis
MVLPILMEKIRVLHCLETVGSGGVEQLRYNLARYLDKERFEQKIVCTHKYGMIPEYLEGIGMEIIAVGNMDSPFHLARYRAVSKIIRSYKPHIVHGAVFEGLMMGTIAGRWNKVPGIIIEETSDPVDRSWRGNLLMRLAGALAHKVVAESDAAGDYVRSVLGIREPKLQVIHNAADKPIFPSAEETAELKAALGIGNHDFVVGSVGRLFDDHKKVSDLIKAVAILKEAIPEIKLLVVGDGNDRDNLIRLCQELSIQDRVIFAGYQGNTAPYYACMDLFAIASQREAFGIVLVEAMYFQLPVVATAVGGIKQVVKDGETGILVEKNNPHTIANAIRDLHGDPDKRKRFGFSGLQRAEQEFSVSKYVKSIDELYTKLSSRKGIEV